MKRRDAFKAGLDFYNTGEPCTNGHNSDRRTMTGGCLVCERERNRAYREKNADRVREYSRVYQSGKSTASKEWIEQPGNGEIYERWVRLFRSFDSDDAAHYVRTATQAMIFKAAGDVFGVVRLEKEPVSAYKSRLIAAIAVSGKAETPAQ